MNRGDSVNVIAEKYPLHYFTLSSCVKASRRWFNRIPRTHYILCLWIFLSNSGSSACKIDGQAYFFVTGQFKAIKGIL